MRIIFAVACVCLLAAGPGCSDDSAAADVADPRDDATGADDGARPDDGTTPEDGAAGDDGTAREDGTAPDDSGTADTPPVPCSTPLAERVRVTSVSVAPNSVETYGGGYFSPDRPVILSPQSDGSSRVAWTDGTGSVHVTPLDGNDNRRGADLTTAGTELRGFAALDDGAAVMVRRDDVMAVVRLDDTGATLFTANTAGGTPHDVEGARWIDDWSHDGRLAWSGSQFAAYHGQTGNHGASGNHQGDRFELLDPAGTRSVYWDWGCSHSLDVRLVWNGTTFGPVCLSDCYPGKGIYFNHYGLVRDEPSGNCAGSSNASLGGLVPAPDGFWLDFVSSEGRTAADVGLVHIGNDGSVGTPVFLTTSAESGIGAAHLARYGDHLLAAWMAGGTPTLAVVTTAGAVVEGPATIEAPFAARDDFVNWPDGDAGWAWSWGDTSQLKVVRVSRCE